MAAKKKKTRIIEVWNKVGKGMDLKDTMISIPELLYFIKTNTPADVKEEDIQLLCEYEEKPYYYDEIVTSCTMYVAVRGTKEVNW